MSRPNVCVSPDLSVEGLTTLLLERGLTAVSVVDGEGELVGVVSTTDLLREVQDRSDGEERVPLRASSPQGVQVAIGEGFHATTLARATVEEILTPFAFTLPATASVAQAAALLALEGLDQIAVLGPEDQIVGALTTLDVVRWLSEQSEFPLPATAPTQGGGYAARARQERRLRLMRATFAREVIGRPGPELKLAP
jgi:CBS-domain-containing membrane protein